MPSHPVTSHDTEITETMTGRDADAVFDRVAQRELGISGAEFLTLWDAGQYEGVDVDEVDGLAEVVGALPFVR